MSVALDKHAQTMQLASNRELEHLAFYLLQEIQNEIDHGSKVADEILYRAFVRLEQEKVKH